MRVSVLDFGKVQVNKSKKKTFEIFNESCRDLMYEAQRDPATNPLDHVFHLRTYTWSLTAGQRLMLEIFYRPFLSFSRDIDYFHIVDSSGGFLKIVARGFCIGPDVSSSVTKIVMHCSSENREAKKRIKLTNNSKAMAIFMFDIHESHEAFKLNLTHGSIDPSSYAYVTISFVPPEVGSYVYYLPCLIMNQDPIIIELYGCCASEPSKKGGTIPRYFWSKVKNGFEGYMDDSVNSVRDLPPVSLSKNHFDLGQADVDAENIFQRIPQVICLTNHSQSDLSIQWQKDEIFNITPRTTQVRACQSALFEIRFSPDRDRGLFYKEITASIVTQDESQEMLKTPEFPCVTSVRAIGHSFPATSSGWIPQYEIPEAVVMPPCVPSFPVYTTFLVKKFGHLPLMFRFVPPPSSRFYVKPMLGLIYQDYQIIAVEMVPKPEGEQIYMERWVVYFNGNAKNECYIDFKGYAEHANLSFGNNNLIKFSPVHPSCQQIERVVMRNVTRHTIKYEFHNYPPELNVEVQSGEVSPNEILSQSWSFCPKEVLDYDFVVECLVVPVKNGNPVGFKNCISLRVTGRSEIGFLVAAPSELNFGAQDYGSTKTLVFHVFNLSAVNIYFKMTRCHCNWPIGNLEEDVEIRPLTGTVFPGGNERISVSVTPRTPGYYEFVIQYFLRLNSQTDTLIPVQVPKNICEAKCFCVLPTLKVENLCTYGSYTNMSKPFLWKVMEIDRFNGILKNLLPGETKALNIYYEPMVLSEDAIFIELVLTNPTSVNATWVLKKKLQCFCKPIKRKRGLSFEYTELNCIHENVCCIHPMSGTLKPGRRTSLTIELRYEILGEVQIKWDLDVGHDRHVSLNMLIEGLSSCEDKLHFLPSTCLNFGKIYLGYKASVYQTHWICNVTNNDLPFSVDVNSLRKINESYCSGFFSCLTPHGVVNARSCKTITVKFRPRSFGSYKVILPVRLGNRESKLILEGEATVNPESKLVNDAVGPRLACKNKEFPVFFSTDCIDLPYIKTHSRVVRMLLVHNDWRNDALAYEWKSQDVAGVLRVEIQPRKGIIQPEATRSFRVEVESRGSPCKIDVNILCEVLNASKRREYQRSVLKHDILRDELKGQFVITEKGTEIPEPWIQKLPKPRVFYKMLTVRCCICGPEDENLTMTLNDELKCPPSKTIYIDDRKEKRLKIEEKELSISLFIVEGLLWDIINSRFVKNIIRETLNSKTDLNYSQFVANLASRKRAIKRSYVSPPGTLIDAVLEKMLFIIVHEEFSLETAHLIPDEDIRHSNYLKTLSKENRRSVQRRDMESRRESETLDNMVRSGSSVTFVE